jgi:hypothetical protein
MMTEEQGQPQAIPEWKSYGSEKEIIAERIKNSRDYLINIRFYKKRKYFGKKLQSRKVDTIDTFRFFPSFKDPRFVEMRKERDFGVQVRCLSIVFEYVVFLLFELWIVGC